MKCKYCGSLKKCGCIEKRLKAIKKELDKFVKLGLLIKIDGKYQDSEYSKAIDGMKSREAFLEGLEKGKKIK